MRNLFVQQAVDLLISLVDRLTEGQVLGAPTSRAIKEIYDVHAQSHGGSIRLACAYLAAYSTIDKNWDFDSIPTGTRGQYGDK